jgi:hypothetical protein
MNGASQSVSSQTNQQVVILLTPHLSHAYTHLYRHTLTHPHTTHTLT